MKEKTYSIFTFYGVREFNGSHYVTKKMKFADFLKNHSHYSIPNTKVLHSSNALFSTENKSVADIRKDVENGVAIFPFSVSMDTDVVKNYISMGLKVVFMNYHDFYAMKKDYVIIA